MTGCGFCGVGRYRGGAAVAGLLSTVVFSGCSGNGPTLPAWISEMGSSTGATGSMFSGDEMTIGDSVASAETAVGAVCGNEMLEGVEECDGVNWNGATCESLGYASGSLACTEGCKFDVDGCLPDDMVPVPEGEFEMGAAVVSDEQPMRQVYLDDFWIDRTEVTVSDYAECEAIGVCAEPSTGGNCNWMVAGREDHPVNCVTWFDADTYCTWVDGGTKRLPTEAEWEKAARWMDARTYPWGDTPEPSCSHVVMDDASAGSDGCGMESTMEVGSKPMGTSPYGAHDMAGNV